MYFQGLMIGVITFLAIGTFHPLVIKAEYHYSSSIWPCFLIAGIIFCVLSLFVHQVLVSATLAVLGFSSFWSIGELKMQEKRVERGWFPDNPNKKPFGKIK